MDSNPLRYVSTGVLPPPEVVERAVEEAYQLGLREHGGQVSAVYPALEEANPNLFGICIIGTRGRTIAIGDADTEFAVMSVVKPFIFAVVSQQIGIGEIRDRIGVNSTGYPFNSLTAIERSEDGRTNPMVNAGAIATTSLVPGRTLEERWEFLLAQLALFGGRTLSLMPDVYESAMASNFRNRAIAASLLDRNCMYSDPIEALDLYTRACSLGVTARDLACMGATLASGGINPLTQKMVVNPQVCHATMAVMITAGLYETSGDWLYDTGLPEKSGIGGGIVTTAPGKGGLGTFAPRLDRFGNSVRGQLVARNLAQALGLDLLGSQPG